MIHKKRTSKLEWKLNKSVYSLKNKNALPLDFLRLGSAINPVNKLLSNSEELRALLPSVVGLSPTDLGWQDRISNYLHDILIEVPFAGYTMDISFTFDIEDSRVKDNIQSYKKDNKIIITSDIKEEVYLLDCILGKKDDKYKVKEEALYKYVIFTDVESYIQYRYCLLSSKVANTVDDVDKSVNIEFYLTSEEEIKEVKSKKVKLKNEASKVYVELVSGDKTAIDNIVVGGSLVNSLQEYKSLDFEEKCSLLLETIDTNPSIILGFSKDITMKDKYTIQMLIWKDIFKVLQGSTVIVDSTDATKIIGNTMDEAISFINNKINMAYMSEVIAKGKSLN